MGGHALPRARHPHAGLPTAGVSPSSPSRSPRSTASNGAEGRESFEAGAALKALHPAPRHAHRKRRVSRAVGSCTREAVTRSYGRWRGLGGLHGQSVREEERAAAERDRGGATMDPDEVIVLAAPLMPVRARRIKHYEDPHLRAPAQGGRRRSPGPGKRGPGKPEGGVPGPSHERRGPRRGEAGRRRPPRRRRGPRRPPDRPRRRRCGSSALRSPRRSHHARQ